MMRVHYAVRIEKNTKIWVKSQESNKKEGNNITKRKN